MKPESSEPFSQPVRSSASGKDSPLTPALSPLRGEGARQAIVFEATFCAASVAFWKWVKRSRKGNKRGDRLLNLDARPSRTPSPLNGERAGVRGEMVRCVPPSRGFENSSLDLTLSFRRSLGRDSANPNGVVSIARTEGRNPVGVGTSDLRLPRVARASHPRASSRNPVGIQESSLELAQ